MSRTMKRHANGAFLATVLATFLFFAVPRAQEGVSVVQPPSATLARIEQATGARGEYIDKEKVFKVGFPRSDLQTTVAGVRMIPPLGLGVWASFQIAGGEAMVMGDMVMTEDQVNPVLDAALASGLAVTAIHNHFLWDSPKIVFMHICAGRARRA